MFLLSLGSAVANQYTLSFTFNTDKVITPAEWHAAIDHKDSKLALAIAGGFVSGPIQVSLSFVEVENG
jgi:hypothetical protein